MVGIDLISSHKMLKLQHQMKKDHIIWLASPRVYSTLVKSCHLNFEHRSARWSSKWANERADRRHVIFWTNERAYRQVRPIVEGCCASCDDHVTCNRERLTCGLESCLPALIKVWCCKGQEDWSLNQWLCIVIREYTVQCTKHTMYQNFDFRTISGIVLGFTQKKTLIILLIVTVRLGANVQ